MSDHSTEQTDNEPTLRCWYCHGDTFGLFRDEESGDIIARCRLCGRPQATNELAKPEDDS